MRKLIAWNVMTLDGCFEGAQPWDLSFHQLVWGEDLQQLSNEQLSQAGLLLFGRKTYEGMASYWPSAPESEASEMNTLPKAVISNTLERADWKNTRLLKGDGVELVRGLKAEEGGTIFVFGSADLLSSLLAAGLVDEYRICIAPILIGKGTPLFKPQPESMPLELVYAKPLPNGGVLVNYRAGLA